MRSAIIYYKRSLSTMLYTKQLINNRFIFLGLLILKFHFFYFLDIKYAADRDQTVSRRSEPSSRNALIGEQPNP